MGRPAGPSVNCSPDFEVVRKLRAARPLPTKDGSDDNVDFLVPVRHPHNSPDWSRLKRNLAQT